MQIKTLLGDKIMVLPEVIKDRKSPGGIILLDSAKSTRESMQRGVVVLKGTGIQYKIPEEKIEEFRTEAKKITNNEQAQENIVALCCNRELAHHPNITMDDVHVKREVCWKAGAGMWFDDVDDHGAPIKYLILNHADLMLV